MEKLPQFDQFQRLLVNYINIYCISIQEEEIDIATPLQDILTDPNFSHCVLNEEGYFQIQNLRDHIFENKASNQDDIYCCAITILKVNSEMIDGRIETKRITKNFMMFYKIEGVHCNEEIRKHLKNIKPEEKQIEVTVLPLLYADNLEQNLVKIFKDDDFSPIQTKEIKISNSVDNFINKKIKKSNNKFIFGLLLVGTIGATGWLTSRHYECKLPFYDNYSYLLESCKKFLFFK